MLLIFMLCSVALIARAVNLQVMETDFLQGQGKARFLREVTIASTRGVITDRNGEPLAVKWKDMKVHFREAMSDSWTAPLLKRQIPAIYDLGADPGEQNDLMETELTVAWVIAAVMAPLIELKQSAAQYPHVEVGADFQGYD